jgi:prevent-host-death family protein
MYPRTAHEDPYNSAEAIPSRSDFARRFTFQRKDRNSTCATVAEMIRVGLRELRQNASDLVKRVETGEAIEITVAGRLAARMIPVVPRQWQRWDDIADVFAGRPDPEWERDRDLLDQSLSNPWEGGDEGAT